MPLLPTLKIQGLGLKPKITPDHVLGLRIPVGASLPDGLDLLTRMKTPTVFIVPGHTEVGRRFSRVFFDFFYEVGRLLVEQFFG